MLSANVRQSLGRTDLLYAIPPPERGDRYGEADPGQHPATDCDHPEEIGHPELCSDAREHVYRRGPLWLI